MNRRILIISPHFPPINAADMQRVRTSLPYFCEFGWEATILTVIPEQDGGLIELALNLSLPNEVPVHRVPIWSEVDCRRFGFGHFGLRCVIPLYRAGTRLLEEGRFDLIYFSTTMFNVFPLGRIWKERFGVPFVLDIQDPWYAGPVDIYNRATAPGGWFKYGVTQKIARYLERFTMEAVDGIVSVSKGYVENLEERYERNFGPLAIVLPFGAAFKDFEILSNLGIRQEIFNSADGCLHFVAVGRGGSDLEPILRHLFSALAHLRNLDPMRWERVRIHFVGTSYAPQGRAIETVYPIAKEFGVGDLVSEHVDRVPYFVGLQIMVDSDGILMIGSPSADYTASKLFSCVLAGPPILGCLHRDGLVAGFLREIENARLVDFVTPIIESELEQKARAGLEWLVEAMQSEPRRTRWSRLSEFSARELTRLQCSLFDRIVKLKEGE